MRREGFPSRVQPIVLVLWVAYFAIVPVDWFPGVDPSAMRVGKWILLALAVGLTFVLPGRRVSRRGVFVAIALIGLTVLSVPGFAQGLRDPSLRHTVSLAAGALLVWVIADRPSSSRLLLRAGAAAVVIHGVLALGIIAAWMGWIELQITGHDLAISGFGTTSSDWANGTALFVPLAVAVAVGRESIALRLGLVGASFAVVLSQGVVAGRAGLIVSLLAAAFVVAVRFGWRGVVGSVVALGTTLGLLAAVWSDRMLINRLVSSEGGLGAFSNGRFELNRFGWEQITDAPLLGHGFGIPTTPLPIGSTGQSYEIHNLWLRLWAESGILLPAALLILIGGVIVLGAVAARATGQGERPSAGAILAVVAGGIVLSLLEPRILVGAVHVNVVVWLAMGVLIGSMRPRGGQWEAVVTSNE